MFFFSPPNIVLPSFYWKIDTSDRSYDFTKALNKSVMALYLEIFLLKLRYAVMLKR